MTEPRGCAWALLVDALLWVVAFVILALVLTRIVT